MKIKHAEGIASRLYKTDAAALRQALEIDDDKVEDIDESKFIEWLESKQSEVIKDRFDRGYKKAQSESLGSLEKEIRKEFNLDSDLKGLDLIKHLTDSVREEAAKSTGKSKLTDDDVKKHPLYLELEKAKKTEVETVKTEWEKKVKDLQESAEQEKIFAQVKDQAKSIFQSMGDAVLPEDAAIAERYVSKLLYDELANGRKFQRNGEDFVILKADGSREEDKMGNAKSLKDVVTEIAKANFQFKASQDRKSPGNGGGSGGGSTGGGKTQKYTGAAPKDAKEYVSLLTSQDLSIEAKTEIRNVYGPQFNGN